MVNCAMIVRYSLSEAGSVSCGARLTLKPSIRDAVIVHDAKSVAISLVDRWVPIQTSKAGA